jgi:SAM-dependent methyltransferase
MTKKHVSEAMLNQLRQKLPEIPPNLKLICGDASQLPFSDGSFDVVLTVHMLFCHNYYGSLEVELSSPARFEIWAYTAS